MSSANPALVVFSLTRAIATGSPASSLAPFQFSLHLALLEHEHIFTLPCTSFHCSQSETQVVPVSSPFDKHLLSCQGSALVILMKHCLILPLWVPEQSFI